MTSEVETLVEDIRSQVQTYCEDGAGATPKSKMHLVAPQFRARQEYKARVVSYLEGSFNEVESRGLLVKVFGGQIQAILSFSAFNMTQLPGIQQSLRNTKGTPEDTDFAKTRKLDGGGGGKRNLSAHGEFAYDYEFFLHYGWGGNNNKWLKVIPISAYISK